jgi:hypothetical protein
LTTPPIPIAIHFGEIGTMSELTDPGRTKRCFVGGVVGALIALTCFGIVTGITFERAAIGPAVLEAVVGISGGCAGASTRTAWRAVGLGTLATSAPSLFLVSLSFCFQSNYLIAVLKLLCALGALGGLCGLVGHIVGRAVPNTAGTRFSFQFTIKEMLCTSLLLALFLGFFSDVIRTLQWR